MSTYQPYPHPYICCMHIEEGSIVVIDIFPIADFKALLVSEELERVNIMYLDDGSTQHLDQIKNVWKKIK